MILASPALLATIASAAFLLSLSATWLARRYALRRRLIDEPGARRSHVVATPRGGGISLAIVLLLALASLLVVRGPALVPGVAMAALVAVAGVGWADDHRPLSAMLRLAVHGFAACALAVAVMLTGGGVAVTALVFAAVLVLVNVWNFMDGIDGMAASQGLLVALGAFAWFDDPGARVLALVLAAGACGFLPFNLPRARIFLGDVGSGSLGVGLAIVLALACGADAGTGRAPAATWLLLLLPVSAFMVDASLTLARRMVRGEQWWTPHVDHAYQRWAARMHDHVPVTLAYAAWTMAAVVVMLVMQPRSATSIMAVVSGWYLLAVAAWFGLQGRGRMHSEGRRA